MTASILVVSPVSSTDHADAGWPASPLVRPDPDGGATLTLFLDDGVGGAYAYRAIETGMVVDTLQGYLGDAKDAVDPADVREMGVFRHTWVHDGAPMLTLGAYLTHADHGPLRMPIIIFENQDAPEALAALAMRIAEDELLYMGANQLPFLLNWALPDIAEVVDGPHTTYGDHNEYPYDPEKAETHPTVYAWFARKATDTGEVWTGLFAERTGSASQGTTHSEADKRLVIGAVTRLDGTETKVAGVAVSQHAERTRASDGTAFDAAQTTDVGLHVLDADRVAVRFHGTDSRHGADLKGDHESQTDLQWGLVGPDGNYVPLVQARTDDERRPAAGGQESETRTSSVGTVVPGIGYVPIVGFGYEGDRSTFLMFPQNLYFGGLIGGDETGDGEWSLGVFVEGAYQPLVAAWYRDDVQGSPYPHQATVALGTYVGDEATPLVAFAYEGDELPQDFAQRFVGGGTLGSPISGDARLSAGTYLGESYTPVFGVEYLDHFDGWAPQHRHQSMVRTGTYLDGDFVPLAGMSYDGEEPLSPWTAAFGLGGALGTPGSEAGRWKIASGPFIDGSFQPVLGIQYQPDLPGGTRAAQSLFSMGTYVGNDYQPVVGMGYDGERPFSLWTAAFLGDGSLGTTQAGDWTTIVGRFAPGGGVETFEPVALLDYRDDFAEAHHGKQARASIALVAPGGLRTDVLVLTYDGTQTLGDWLQDRSGERTTAGRWTAAAGTGATGTYVPLVGTRYTPEHGAPRAWGERFEAGVFAADYDAFIPVATIALSSDQGPADWTGDFGSGGTLGSDPGELQITTTGGIALRYTGSMLHDGGAHEGLVIGIEDDSGFTPVAGAGYRDGTGRGLVGTLTGDAAFHLTAGVFVSGTYTPLVSATIPSREVVL